MTTEETTPTEGSDAPETPDLPTVDTGTPEEPTETTEDATPCANLVVDFGDKRYGVALSASDLNRLGATEFARQAAEMVERTIVAHLGALPMMPEMEVGE